MKKYKLKQTITVSITGANVEVIIIPKGTKLHEDSGYAYGLREDDKFQKIYFSRHGVENTPELFELVVDDK